MYKVKIYKEGVVIYEADFAFAGGSYGYRNAKEFCKNVLDTGVEYVMGHGQYGRYKPTKNDITLTKIVEQIVEW